MIYRDLTDLQSPLKEDHGESSGRASMPALSGSGTNGLSGKPTCPAGISLTLLLGLCLLQTSCFTPRSLRLPSPGDIGIGGIPSPPPYTNVVPRISPRDQLIAGRLNPPGAAEVSQAASGESDIVYMGYSKDFLPAKQQIAAGQLDSLAARVASGSGLDS